MEHFNIDQSRTQKFCVILSVSFVFIKPFDDKQTNKSLAIAGNKTHMNYFSRQIISREVEVEKMRRAGPKFKTNETRIARPANCGKENVPNHLRTLNPRSIQHDKVSKQVRFIYFLSKASNTFWVRSLKICRAPQSIRPRICFGFLA